MKAEGTLPLLFAVSRQDAGSLQGEIVTEADQLFSLEDDWAELVERNPSATVFQNLPWLKAWWSAFREQLNLSSVVVRDGRRVVGILPLIRKGDKIRLLGSPGGDYGDILSVEQRAPEVIAAALRTLLNTDGWRTCYLSNLRDDSQIVRYAAQLPSDVTRHLTITRSSRRSALTLRERSEEIIAAMRRKPALKRHRNKLYRQGDVRFRHLETREEARELLRTLFEQHVWRRALAGERSQFLKPQWRAFYNALVDELDLHNELRFSVLELNGRPLACHLGFESRGRLILYKPTFDVDAWELSPGDVLLSELLAYAGKRKLQEVDFTIGDEAYKEHFTNETRDMFRATLEHDIVRAGLRRISQPVIGRMARDSFCKATARHIVSYAGVLKTGIAERARAALFGRAPNPAVRANVLSKPRSAAETAHFNSQLIRLSDLAELAIQQPAFFNAQLLQEYRTKLRRGDACYRLENSGHSYLLWMTRVVMPDTCEAEVIAGRKADVLYDVLTTNGKKTPLTADLARWFDERATAQGVIPCICVPMLNSVSRNAIRAANFEYRRDLVSVIRSALWQL